MAGIGTVKVNDSINQLRVPEIAGKFVLASLIRVVEAMEHEAVLQFARVVVRSFARAEDAWLHVTLTISRAKKDILPAPTFQASLCDFEVLALNTVLFQLRTVLVPFKVRTHLVLHAG